MPAAGRHQMSGQRGKRRFRASALGIAALLACTTVAFVVWRASSGNTNQYQCLRSVHDDLLPVALDADTESRVVAFCSDCHAMPLAESFPRDAWHDEVRQGYFFYGRSARNDLDPPPMYLTVAYLRSRAPEQFVFPEPEEAETELRAAFEVEQLDLGRNDHIAPGVSHLRWTSLGPDEASVLLACDMRLGYVAAVDLRGQRLPPRILARLANPCHVEPCDLDGNSAVDLVVADLGSFFPADHDHGRVVWLQRQEAASSFAEVVVASGLGRVADARPADLDADGDLDLIVAEFGHYRTGKIVLLRNVGLAGERLRFEPEEFDPRPGTTHVPLHDFDRDGRLDFVAWISQEHEQVEAFMSHGDGQFYPRTLWAAPDLTFGSSGIELVDLDQDGDMDILYTNGDAFDNAYVNPSHGVQWLENLGEMDFAYHRLADMTGAYRALAGDIDLDGDLDIIATAWLPAQPRPAGLTTASLPSILCLEQTSPGEFIRHTLETGSPYHAALEVADFDRDGDLDFAVGSLEIIKRVADARKTSYWVAVWWNQVISASE